MSARTLLCQLQIDHFCSLNSRIDQTPNSQSVNKLSLCCCCCCFPQEGSENEEEEREEEEEENTDYLTDSNKENETDEENNVRSNTSIRRAVDKRFTGLQDYRFLRPKLLIVALRKH